MKKRITASAGTRRYTALEWAVLIGIGLSFAASTGVVCADERFFTYSQEAEVLPQGHWEFEQWLTHRYGKSGGLFSAWDFREEIEYGLLDNLKAAGYLNFRQTTDKRPGGVSEFEFEGVSAELKYRILNPDIQPAGLAFYFEPTYNGAEVELEEKLILQKNFGEKWRAVLNATLEQEWARGSIQTGEELKVEFTAGVTYRMSPRWSVGLEGRNLRAFVDGIGFDHREHDAWFVGPNVHYGSKNGWATLTVLPQVHGTPNTSGGLQLEDHEKIEIRLIAGINF
ncbi:MAG: hypothetical protein DME19_19310 [Verrucomicrobia bacterium]|nr:MAG: hypothetical protein DME19_19310 [Verrucomicrobiota bacterium]